MTLSNSNFVLKHPTIYMHKRFQNPVLNSFSSAAYNFSLSDGPKETAPKFTASFR